jgi:hypothetical protein
MEANENIAPMGEGGQVQADETYYDNTSKRSKSYKKGHSHKASVVALVDPASGQARAFHVPTATADTVRHILVNNADRKSTLVTMKANFTPRLVASSPITRRSGIPLPCM